MTDLSEFQRKARKSHPQGFEPGIVWNSDTGGTITAQLDNEPDESIWAMLIADWGLDPTRTQVVDGSLQIRAWDAPDPEGGLRRLFYYRATIKPREEQADRADIEALCAMVMKRKPRAGIASDTNAASSFLLLLSDFQLGKGEGGGTPATIERILLALDKAVVRYKELRKQGRVNNRVYLIGLGDLVESCRSDWYASQTFQADLSDREQDRLARRLILRFVDAFVDLGCEVVAVGVPGNHGENRQNGRAFTNFLDNRDYAAFETVAEICAANPDRYGSTHFPLNAINDDDLSLTLDIGGVVCSFAHGHQFRSGTNAQAKMEGWWKGQVMGNTSVGDASILFAGHLHHFVASESTGRQVFQVPAMDGGSQWFKAVAGANAQAGLMSIVIGSDCSIRGWDDLKIL